MSLIYIFRPLYQLMPLSVSQLSSYKEKGYIKIPAIIPPALLFKLQSLFDELMYHCKDESGKASNRGKNIQQRTGKQTDTTPACGALFLPQPSSGSNRF
jgi:hypothetical protein